MVSCHKEFKGTTLLCNTRRIVLFGNTSTNRPMVLQDAEMAWKPWARPWVGRDGVTLWRSL